MIFLTIDHQHPPYYIEHNGMLFTANMYNNDVEFAQTLGLYRHDSEPGSAPLGYTSWEERTDSHGVFYYRSLAGTQEEREVKELEQYREGLSVTALQGMRAIKQAGKVVEFNTWMSSLDPIDDFETIAFFQKAQTWIRTNPVVITAATLLGFTEEELDQLFELAKTL